MNDAVMDAAKLPLIEHFRELRKRVMIALIAFLAGVGVCYGFAEQIYGFLVQPLADTVSQPEHRRLIYTSLTEAFFTYLRLAMFAGFFLAFPVIAAQLYLFIAPGLYKKERRVFLPYLIAAPLLFMIGAALCYYLIFPMAWKFFLGFESAGTGHAGLPIQLEAKVSEYLSLVMHLILAFGISFQLPVVLVLLAQFGAVRAESLARGRRFAVVIIAACAAVITPPDAFSMLALCVPLYLLYELSILACRVVEGRRMSDHTMNDDTKT